MGTPRATMQAIAIWLLLLIGTVGCASQKALLREARISREQAERIALDKVPQGQIREGELEKEQGKLVWSFDIATPGSTAMTEILVDAKTGAVVEVKQETVKQEATEKQAEKK